MSVQVQTPPRPPTLSFARSRPSRAQQPVPTRQKIQQQPIPGILKLPTQLSVSSPRATRSRQRKQDLSNSKPDEVELTSKSPATPNKRQAQKDARQSPKKPSSPPSSVRTPPSRKSARTSKHSQVESVFADLSDIESPPTTGSITAPSSPQPASTPSRPPRTRRTKTSPTTAPVSVPITIRPGSLRAKLDPSRQHHLSRSAPLSSTTNVGTALPDWDSPPALSSEVDEPEFDVFLTSSDAFTDRAMVSGGRAALKSKSSPNLLFPMAEPPSPGPVQRPVNRHIRTASVPSLSVALLHKKSSDSDDDAQEKKIKYAGSRFQTAPAPTFVPMPAF